MKGKMMNPAALKAALRGDLANAIAASTPGGIERQEAAGQAALVANAALPKDLNGNTKEQFEKIGIVFGSDDDDLFVNVSLPAGWKKVATDHSMWSDLVDDQGRKRAEVFYKAAFYDRSAHMNLTRRYHINGYLSCDASGAQVESEDPTHYLTAVMDGGKVIHVVGHRERRDYETSEQHRRKGCQWLDQNFPDWQDPTAYWDAA